VRIHPCRLLAVGGAVLAIIVLGVFAPEASGGDPPSASLTYTVTPATDSNVTRVASYIMVAEGTNRTYNHIGVSDAFHPLSHHQNDKARKERLVKIQTYHSQAFAKFLATLAAMPDGDGSMLDHSILLYGSNMSNSNAHDEFPLPNIVVGGGCGKIKGGQHLRYPDRTPLANLLFTLLLRAGVPVDKVGDSTGELAEV